METTKGSINKHLHSMPAVQQEIFRGLILQFEMQKRQMST
jgi:hypothetical protein